MYFTAEEGPTRHLVLCKCWRPWIKPTRKRSGWHHGRTLPPKRTENISLHTFSQLLPQEGLSGLPTHVLWTFLQPGKRMLLLSHNRVWHASEDPVVCPSQTLPWCPERQFLWSKLNLLSIISRPWVYFSTSGWQPPSRGNTASRCWVEKGTPAQNHPCRSWHFPSWASDSATVSRRHSWFKNPFPWQLSTALARRRCTSLWSGTAPKLKTLQMLLLKQELPNKTLTGRSCSWLQKTAQLPLAEHWGVRSGQHCLLHLD